jgi:hypothetical protein
MSGFSLVIVVMLIMFASIAIVLTQGDDLESMESSERVEPIPPASDDFAALPSDEILIDDGPFDSANAPPLGASGTVEDQADENDAPRVPKSDE